MERNSVRYTIEQTHCACKWSAMYRKIILNLMQPDFKVKHEKHLESLRTSWKNLVTVSENYHMYM